MEDESGTFLVGLGERKKMGRHKGIQGHAHLYGCPLKQCG